MAQGTGSAKMDTSPLDFLFLMGHLKHVPRTGWLRTISAPESVASHSFRVAVMGMFAPEPLDRNKCIFLGLVHDMAESVVGDIPTYAGVPKETKYQLELHGFQHIVNVLKHYDQRAADSLMEAWLEYEQGQTPEAKWMKEMDKLDCLIQAHEYEQQTFGEKDLEEFQGLTAKIHSPQASAWLAALQALRSDHFAKRRHRDWALQEDDSAALCAQLYCKDLFLDDVFRKYSNDPECIHADTIQRCLTHRIAVPVEIVTEILEHEINRLSVEDGGWLLVHGFPASVAQLREFERKVQKPNYTVFLKGEADGGSEDPDQNNAASEGALGWANQSIDMIDYLRTTPEYFAMVPRRTGGDTPNVQETVKAAILCFKSHAEA